MAFAVQLTNLHSLKGIESSRDWIDVASAESYSGCTCIRSFWIGLCGHWRTKLYGYPSDSNSPSDMVQKLPNYSTQTLTSCNGQPVKHHLALVGAFAAVSWRLWFPSIQMKTTQMPKYSWLRPRPLCDGRLCGVSLRFVVDWSLVDGTLAKWHRGSQKCWGAPWGCKHHGVLYGDHGLNAGVSHEFSGWFVFFRKSFLECPSPKHQPHDHDLWGPKLLGATDSDAAWLRGPGTGDSPCFEPVKGSNRYDLNKNIERFIMVYHCFDHNQSICCLNRLESFIGLMTSKIHKNTLRIQYTLLCAILFDTWGDHVLNVNHEDRLTIH